MNSARTLRHLSLLVLSLLLAAPAFATPQLANADPAVLLQEGTAAEQQGNKKEALDKLSIAKNVFQKQGNIAGQAEAHLQLGIYQSHYGSDELAMEEFNQAVALYTKAKDNCGLARAVATQQSTAKHSEAPPAALKVLDANQKLARAHRCNEALATTLTETGHIYRKTNAEKAQLYYAEAIELYRTLGNQLGEGNALNGMASLYIKSQPKRAKKLLTEALTAYDKARYTRGKVLSYLALGVVAIQMSDKEAATDWFTRSKETAEKIQQLDLAEQAESMLERLTR